MFLLRHSSLISVCRRALAIGSLGVAGVFVGGASAAAADGVGGLLDSAAEPVTVTVEDASGRVGESIAILDVVESGADMSAHTVAPAVESITDVATPVVVPVVETVTDVANPVVVPVVETVTDVATPVVAPLTELPASVVASPPPSGRTTPTPPTPHADETPSVPTAGDVSLAPRTSAVPNVAAVRLSGTQLISIATLPTPERQDKITRSDNASSLPLGISPNVKPAASDSAFAVVVAQPGPSGSDVTPTVAPQRTNDLTVSTSGTSVGGQSGVRSATDAWADTSWLLPEWMSGEAVADRTGSSPRDPYRDIPTSPA